MLLLFFSIRRHRVKKMFTTRGRVYSPGQAQGTVIKNTGDGTGTF